jgi:hypothetical protein
MAKPKNYQSLKDFLKDLYQHRDALTRLFSKRAVSVRHEDMMQLLDQDYDLLERLHYLSFISGDEQRGYALDDRLTEFFEKFLEAEEDIHPAFIESFLNRIKENISYYDLEKNPRKRDGYLHQIGRDLRLVGRTAIRQTITLNEKVKYVYETEQNPAIKKKKLEDIRQKRDMITVLIKQMKHLLETEGFFKSIGAEELSHTIFELRQDLQDAEKFLIEVQQHVIEYLNRSRELSQVLEKLQKLKRLKDRHELREYSSLEHILQETQDIFYSGRSTTKLPLELAQLEEEENYPLLLKVAEKKKRKSEKQPDLAAAIEESYLNPEVKEAESVRMEHLKNRFLSQHKDLFTFLMEYPFEKKDMSEADKVKLYCKLASLYEAELDFTEELSTFGKYEYAVIMAGN